MVIKRAVRATDRTCNISVEALWPPYDTAPFSSTFPPNSSFSLSRSPPSFIAPLPVGAASVLIPFIRLISWLPLELLQWIGAGCGRLILRLSPGYRRQVVGNLAQAGYPSNTDDALVGRAAAEAGRGALELAHVWMRPQAEVLARTRATGWEHVEAARAAGNGIVFMTPHLGCFEVTAQYYANNAAAGAPLTVLYRPPRKRSLAPLIEGRRARGNLMLAPADLSGVKRLFRALKRGEAIGMLPDQVPSRGEGVWAPFFGKHAYTMTLPARLQRQTGAALLLAHGERLADGEGWIVHFSTIDEPLSDDPVTAATQINAALERLIRDNPEQYLWGYNRYKTPRSAPASPDTIARADERTTR